ncbi:MAG: hypothetical protein JJT76_17790 [Clostridiaceae bacterium]|nr:hypothetical protein [Clostridiaceae bacterium]
MNNLHYCMDCRRIASFNEGCTYCESENIKGLTKKAPVNVIGTKVKGNVFNSNGETVNLICVGPDKEKTIREYEADQLQKIL